jgi:hypothetical protein
MACSRFYTRLIAFMEKEMITIGRRSLAGFAMCSLLSLVFAPASWSNPNNVMPQMLVDVALANGCNPIDDFFDQRDPDLMNAPYVLGWVSEAPYSAVFWCKKTEKSDRPYQLIFAAGEEPYALKLADPKQLAGCPAVIEYWNRPSGLRIETQRNLELSSFYPVTEFQRPKPGGPTGVLASARVLVSDNGDGLEGIFLCYKGQWLIRLLE